MKTILLVDDEDDLRITMRWFLTSFGFAVDAVRNAEQALALFDPRIHDVVITDNAMPGMTGLEMAHVIKLRSPGTPVMMHTGQPPTDQSCLDFVMQKPSHMLAVKDVLDMMLQKREGKPDQSTSVNASATDTSVRT